VGEDQAMVQKQDNLDRLLGTWGAEANDPRPQQSVAATILLTEAFVGAAPPGGSAEAASPAVLPDLMALLAQLVEEYRGRLARTVGQAAMAEFADPGAAVRAAAELQRRLLLLHKGEPERQRAFFRMGLSAGTALRRGGNLGGEAVEAAARIARHAGPAQVLISRAVREALALDPGIRCVWAGTLELTGRPGQEEIYEVIWTDPAHYARLRTTATSTLEWGERETAGLPPEDLPVPAPPTPPPAGGLPPAEGVPPGAISTRYEILGELGSGGMGVVYKARDHETGELVALKSLRSEVAADAHTMERFKNELRLARRITHKNVCRIHDFVRSDGTAYISMEFVEGETLRSVLSRFGSMGVRKGIQIARQICSGLAEAHGQGIVHRDLKPENVMIDRRGNVKLMDFGIARSLQGGVTTGAGVVIGTPAYMSPEQAEGRPVDARSDIYSLGLVLYEMFAGVAAFHGETPVSLALKQIRERPLAPREHDANLPEYLEQTILRCLEKNPAARFSTVAELDDALSRQTLTPWSTPVDAGTSETRAAWFRRREQTLLLLGGLGLGLLAYFVGDMYPASHLRLQLDFDEARSQARRFLKELVPAVPVSLSRKALVWIDGRGADDSRASDPSHRTHDFTWQFRWRGPNGLDVGESEGSIEIDYEGKLRSWNRGSAGRAGPRLESSPEALRAKAAELCRSLLGFDVARASVKTDERRAANGDPYSHFEWTATAPDDRGYRTASVDLSGNGVDAIGTSYANYIRVPVIIHPWTDVVGGFLFGALFLVVFLTRTVNIGAGRLRRPLIASAAVGVWGGACLESIFPGLPGFDWTADLLLGVAMFALIFVAWAAGEDIVLSLWPQKVTTWVRPLDGRWLSRAAAVSVLRGTLWGLAFLAIFVPLTSFASPLGWIRLRTWSLEWPQTTTWSPPLKLLFATVAGSVPIAIGPIAVFISLMRKRLRSVWVLLIACGFLSTLVYQPELLRVEKFEARLLLLFITLAWFSWSFYESDVLGTVAALVVFDGVAGLWAMLQMNLDLSVLPFVLAFSLLAAVPAFALLSLHHRDRAAGSADPVNTGVQA
jgi:tRNA A-37 threonylcarbamoyl transferase component Bud32